MITFNLCEKLIFFVSVGTNLPNVVNKEIPPYPIVYCLQDIICCCVYFIHILNVIGIKFLGFYFS